MNPAKDSKLIDVASGREILQNYSQKEAGICLKLLA